MYRDEKISVKTYHDMLKTPMLLVLYILSFHLHNSKWAYDSQYMGESPEKHT